MYLYYIYIYVLCVHFFDLTTPQRQKGRREGAQPSLVPGGVIDQNWIRPWRTDEVPWCTRSPPAGSKALYCRGRGAKRGGGVSVSLIRHTVRLTVVALRVWGTPWFCPFVLNISCHDCLCAPWHRLRLSE